MSTGGFTFDADLTGEVGHFIDRYGSKIRVTLEKGDIILHAEGRPSYEDPTPHLTVDMAEALVVLLGTAIHTLTADCPPNPEATVPHIKGKRGFVDYGEPFNDLNGHEIYVRESSIAGDPCVWVFCSDHEPYRLRYEAHKKVWDSWTPEEQERRLPDWIRYDYSSGTSDHTQLREYTDCPEKKEELLRSWLTQKWDGEPDFPPNPTPRLSPQQARTLQERLLAFVEDSRDPDHWKNSESYIATWRQ